MTKFNFICVGSNNGDAIAQQYTGTGALNSQFILSGHHHGERNRAVFWRKLADGYNAIGRYYSNNFVDSYRQDDFDLFLGNHHGHASKQSK